MYIYIYIYYTHSENIDNSIRAPREEVLDGIFEMGFVKPSKIQEPRPSAERPSPFRQDSGKCYIYIYIYIYTHVYIYIYIYREREI